MSGAWEPLSVVFSEIEKGRGRGLSSTARHVAVWIARHMNESGECFPSMKRLAQLSGLGLTATRAAVKEACDPTGGLFVREPGGAREGARYRSSKYTLRELEPLATRAPHEVSPSPREREGFATRARGVRDAVTKNLLNDSLKNRGLHQKDGRVKTADEVEEEEQERFERWRKEE